MLTTILAVMALQSAPFDLTCHGIINRGMPSVSSTTTPEETEARIAALPSRPWSVRYRVDIEANRWCSGECLTTAPIERLNSSRILIDGVNINRMNLKAQKFTPDVRDWLSGDCQVVEFSGMPSQAF